MTKEEVQEYIDNYISHIISMVEYGNWFADEINQLVEEVREKIEKIFDQHTRCNTKKACREMFNEIDELLKLFEIEVSNFVDNELSKVIIEEDEWLDEYVAEPLDITLDKSRKAIELLKMLPIASAGVIGIYGHTLADRLNTLYRQKINQSYVTGSSFDELEDMYEARFNTFERGLQSESNTIGSSLSEEYDRIVFTKNDKKIDGYLWQSLLDTHVCLVCGDRSGKIYKDITEVPPYPAHLNCVTGDTLISTSSPITRIYRRTYKGTIYRIKSTSGYELSITPNHPILTDRGFIPAKLLKVGDNIVLNDGFKTINIVGKYKDNTVTSAENLFSSFRESSSVFASSMEITSKDFHNDISDQEVNIIKTDRGLSNKVDILTFKKVGKSIFVDGHARFLMKKLSHSLPFFFFGRNHSSFRSFMTSFCKSCNLFWRSKFHSLYLLFSSISLRNIINFKKINHLFSFKTKSIGDSFNANSFIVKFKNLCKICVSNIFCVSSSMFDTTLSDGILNSMNTDIELSRNLLCCNSSLIKFDSLISIEEMDFFGQVYNLETVDNFYYANGITVHNCRCSVMPINSEIKDSIPETYEEWFEKQPKSEKYKILGKTRFQLYENGMKIKNFVNNGRKTPLKDLNK